MTTIEKLPGVAFLALLVAVAGGAVYFLRQSRRDLPKAHPRRRRARALFVMLAGFFAFCMFTAYGRRIAYAPGIEGAGFIALLVLAFAVTTRTPGIAEVRAYEEAFGNRTSEEPPPRRPRPDTPPPWREPSPEPARSVLERGTRDWALHELALSEPASRETVSAAYRRLIRMAHPDHGGDTGYAADLNLARKVLLG